MKLITMVNHREQCLMKHLPDNNEDVLYYKIKSFQDTCKNYRTRIQDLQEKKEMYKNNKERNDPKTTTTTKFIKKLKTSKKNSTLNDHD